MDIGKQLLECLKYEDTSNRIDELDKQGLLEELIPSIKDMKEVGKCKYHIVNTFQHSLYTLIQFESILRTEKFIPSHLRKQVWEYLNSKDESGFLILEILKLGVFLHDIGKPAAKTVDETGRSHFRGHDVTGGELVLNLGKKIGLSDATTEKLFKYVRYHMMLLIFFKINDLSKENLWKLFDKLGDDVVGVMLLGYCDLHATRKLLDPLEDNGVLKTYMEYILTVYFYKYKTNEEQV